MFTGSFILYTLYVLAEFKYPTARNNLVANIEERAVENINNVKRNLHDFF